ncbi:MAG: DUF2182 domain-containing protein [Pseudomonadota bacterium]
MRRLAAFAAHAGAGPLPALLALSGAAYLVLAFMPQTAGLAALCGSLGIEEVWRFPEAVLFWTSPGALALEWVLMVVAMMTPITAFTLAYAHRSLAPQSRRAGIAGFLLGYWVAWSASIAVVLPLSVLLVSAVGQALAFPVALALALIHAASPMAQRARNRAHGTLRLAPFGLRAMRDCIRLGIVSGLRCIAVCWPWMVLPMTVESWHLVLMMLVGLYLLADRLAPPAPPVWRIPPAWETLMGPSRLSVPRRVS